MNQALTNNLRCLRFRRLIAHLTENLNLGEDVGTLFPYGRDLRTLKPQRSGDYRDARAGATSKSWLLAPVFS